MVKELNNLKCLINYHIDFLEIETVFIEKLKLINKKNSVLNILSSNPSISNSVRKIIEISEIEYIFKFFVKCKNDIKELEKFIFESKVLNYQLHPYYNYNNESFLMEEMYLNEEDILNVRIDIHDVYQRQFLNIFNYGKLIFKSNGECYTNINSKSIGNISDNSFLDIIYSAVFEDEMWSLTRKKLFPCRNCTFNVLCPSVSNYEMVIGKYNLCNIIN